MSYAVTKNRIVQWLGIILIIGVFVGAYWYFKVYGSTLNAPQNDLNTNGLVGMWSFNGDDVSGTTVYDRSGAGLNGTLSGSTAVTQGKVGQAMDFLGSGSQMAISMTQTGQTYTFSTWTKLTTAASGYFFDTSTGRLTLSFGFNAPAARSLSFYDGNWKSIGSANSIPLNEWVHLVWVFDNSNSTAYGYINGVLQGTAAYVGKNISASTRIGNHFSAGDAPMAGTLDEVRIYNRALSVSEIQSLYTQGSGTKVDSAVSQPQGTGRLDSGLAGYWKLDDGSGTSATDSSTNGNTGTLTNGPTWTTGQIGGAVTFDGTDDRVVTTHTTNLNTYPITVSTWVKTSVNDATRRPIVSKYSFLNGYALYMSGGKVLAWYMGNGSNYIYTGAEGIISTTTVSDDAWHNVVFTVDTVGGKLYVDGKLEASRAWTGTPQASTTTNGLGLSYPDGGSFTAYLAASIDDTRIYNRALSAAEVGQLYRLTTPTSVDTGLKGYWSFNGKDVSGTTAYDRSGAGNNGTLTNSPTVVTGKLGQALNFDGTNDYVNVTNIPLTGDFTMSSWFYTSTNSQTGMIFGEDSPGTLTQKIGIVSGNIFVRVVLEGSSDATISAPAVNQWHHMVVTRNSSNKIDLYVDGGSAMRLFSDAAQTGTWTVDTIGNHGGNSEQYFNGKLDEVRIYNRALAAGEVKGLYDVGADDKTNSSVSQPQGTGRLDSGLAGYWKLDDGSGTSATDSSTNGNTGTLTNGPTWGAGQVGGAVTFDGVDDSISISDASALQLPQGNKISIGFWYNTAMTSGAGTVYSKIAAGPTLYQMNVVGGAGTHTLRVYYRSYNGSSFAGIDNVSIGSYSNSVWHHVLTTFDTSTGAFRAYVDGVLVSSATNIPNSSIAGSGALAIGTASGQPFAGSVDEFRIYNRVLSADEAAQLYRLNAPTGTETGLKGYWSFNGKDLSSTTAYDRSGAGNNGTLTNGPTVATGKIGQALSFDGVNDSVNAGSARIGSAANGITISLWVYTSSTYFDGTAQIVLADNAGDANTENGFFIALDDRAGYQQATNGISVTFDTTTLAARYETVNNVIGSTPGWYHIVALYDPSISDAKLYINGVEVVTTEEISGTGNYIPDTDENLFFGAPNDAAGYFFNGKLDEVRMYNRVLTEAEIKSLYNASR